MLNEVLAMLIDREKANLDTMHRCPSDSLEYREAQAARDELLGMQTRVMQLRDAEVKRRARVGQRKDGESSAAWYARLVLAGGPRAVDRLAQALVDLLQCTDEVIPPELLEVVRHAESIVAGKNQPRVVDALARHVLRWEPTIDAVLRIVERGRAERHAGHAAGCGDVDVPGEIFAELTEAVGEPERVRSCPTPIVEQVRHLEQLKDGWHDGEGKAPTYAALRSAEQCLYTLETFGGRLRPYLYPTEDGGVRAEFADGLKPAILQWRPLSGAIEYPLEDAASWGR